MRSINLAAAVIVASIAFMIAGCGPGENWTVPLPNGHVLHVDSVQGFSTVVDGNSVLIVPATASLSTNMIGIDRVNASGDLVFGHVSRAATREPVGYFILNTRTGQREEQLTEVQFLGRLKDLGASPVLTDVLRFSLPASKP